MSAKSSDTPLRSSALAFLLLALLCGTARAEDAVFYFNIPAESLGKALTDYSRISSRQIIFSEDLTADKFSRGVTGLHTADEAIALLLSGTDLSARSNVSGVVMIQQRTQNAADASSGGATESPSPPAAYGQDVAESILVSATRITADGFSAPTPTTVLSAADLQGTAHANVFDAVVELPSMLGSVGLSGSPNNGISNGLNALSAFSLRGLGSVRTLTLIDGQRIVPANVNGSVDVNLLPQLLIQRVDVVTGGASASWGSDAVGGVVNFVTDTHFTGVKGHVESGMSNYGDEYSGLIQIAAGSDLFGGRGHIEASAEFYNNNGVKGSQLGQRTSTNGRCCNYNAGTLAYTLTTTPPGVPEFTPAVNVQNTSSSAYGLITSEGPLKGIAFDASGMPAPFVFGTNCVGNNCIGGDLSGGGVGATIDDAVTRTNLYARLSYALTPKIQLYGTFNFGNIFAQNETASATQTGISVACGNAPGGASYYLPASVNATCLANNLRSFTLGTASPSINVPAPMHIKRVQRRYVVGASSNFDLFGTDWSFDGYFQHGENNTSIKIRDMALTANLNAAIDAVAGPDGAAVCRSTVAQANGCLPINMFGAARPSAAAWTYAAPLNGPFQISNQRQEAASIVFNGVPLKNWAGDVALALGAEYREEAYTVRGDPYSNGVAAASPLSADYPNNPLLDLVGGNNWRAGNFHNGRGNYHVYEAFVEFGVPIVNTPEWGNLSLNLAGRGTVYSTSGYVNTWKVGLTWGTPLDGIRIRVLQSRDVRAPNLSELYLAPTATLHTVINRLLPASAPPVSLFDKNFGNPNLKPEIAQTTELGLVFQPSWLPGLNASIDYYRIAIKGEIARLTDQQEIDLCQIQMNLSYCSLIFLDGAPGTSTPSYVELPPFNIASQVLEGFDVEADYAFNLNAWDIPGSFFVRALATHTGKLLSDTGVQGQPVTESAGSTVNIASNNTAAGIPYWKLLLVQSWNFDPFTIRVSERFFSDGRINPNGTECQAPNCPLPTLNRRTYSNNFLPGYVFVDVGVTYRIAEGMQVYFQVHNAGDALPAASVITANSDPIGRVYHFGFRFDT